MKLRPGKEDVRQTDIICKFIKVFYYALACWKRMSSRHNH
ncbi:hypothetical protein A628_04908 [Salmonella enterica subsp. enterica serovar Cubana str. 76814]|uniref:Uncharacterized protein n=1 Tax=Salmonella enterica subsp. enterica serovar Cubana str. 76814 TaxID=1192560 RepID=V7IGM0_SALET|nr:hypothetical protein A628_04908 [Salmonella enterica subsp. enterica serovar Cubana str. 76814]